MAEYWETAHIRGQQTVAVWRTWAPTFTFGDVTVVTLDSHQADVRSIISGLDDIIAAEGLVNAAVNARDHNFDFLADLDVRGAEVISGNLEAEDDLRDDLDEVYAITPNTHTSVVTRGKKLAPVWLKVNARRAAATPPLPPLLVGTVTVAQFQTAVAAHEALTQAVEDRRKDLGKVKEGHHDHVDKVDARNKRWFEAWHGNFAAGSNERDALSGVDTEATSNQPLTALEIDTLTPVGLNVSVTYVAGGGRRAQSLNLLYQIIGVDAVFGHDTTVILDGQTVGPFTAGVTVNFKTVAEKDSQKVEGAVKVAVVG